MGGRMVELEETEATTTPVEVRREKVTLRSWRGQTAFVEFKSS